jgi:RNA recognition motif-containing protein
VEGATHFATSRHDPTRILQTLTVQHLLSVVIDYIVNERRSLIETDLTSITMSYYGQQQAPHGAATYLPPIIPASNSSDMKLSRELFVGNTPPGTSELLLLHFLSAAMRRVGLCQPHEAPITEARVNSKFAFIELTSTDLANKALQLNGIPFLGSYLKVSRPSKYSGSQEVHGLKSTWQELTGQEMPGVALDAEQEKLSRELFIGNTTPEMTEHMIKEFLGNAMLQVGLNEQPGNPIVTCRVSGKFAFVEVRTAQEAKNALNLNNIPFLGSVLRVGRPSKWNGPPDPHGNWEDILAKFMAGELVVKPVSAAPITPSRVVQLCNMLSDQDLANDDEYQDILEDTREECSQFGKLVSVIIPKAGELGATKIFLEYQTTEDAMRAIKGLEGRTFDGRIVEATLFDETRFANKNYA